MTYKEFNEHRLKYVWDNLDNSRKVPLEDEVEDQIERYFSQWFTVYRQVYSDCGKSKCDILMYHKEEGSPQIPFIIEIKRDTIKQGHTLGEWCLQAGRYANTTWHTGKKAIVVVFPQISGLYFDEGCLVKPHDLYNHEHSNINSFLYGAFKIGEIRQFNYHEKKGYSIIMNNRILWQSAFPFQLHSKRIPNGYTSIPGSI